MELAICLGFARVRDVQGRYALVPSYSAPMGYEPGYLLPPGGQLAMLPEGRKFLESMGVPGMIGSNSLRFCVPDGRFRAIDTWFRSRTGRQVQVTEKVRQQLLPNGGHVVSAEFAGIVVNHTRFDGKQSRFGEDMRLAHLIEVHDIVLDRPVYAGTGKNASVVFADAPQIMAGKVNAHRINDVVALVINR